MAFFYCRDLYKRTEWSVEVDEPVVTFGGSSTATVPLPDRSLDACEVVVQQGPTGYSLEERTGSGRVTWNDSPLPRGAPSTRPLKSGDRIGLGRVQVVFFLERPAQLAAEAALGPAPPVLEPGPDPRFGLRQLVALAVATWFLGVGAGLVLGILGLGRQ